MRIADVAVASTHLPLAESFPVSYESNDRTDHVFVRLTTADGTVGYGEGTTLPWFTGEVAAGAAAVVERYLAPTLEGASLAEAARAHESFLDAFPGAAAAKAAVDLALVDLRGKRAGVPAHDLLGARVTDEVPVTWVLPAVDPATAAARARERAAAGFRSFKLKADGDVTEDVERVDAVLDAIPDDARLRVDANTGWRRFSVARRAVEAVSDPDRLEYVEQPVAVDRPDDMRRLWEATGVPVFADEAASTPADVERLGRDDVVAGCHLKLAKSGSLARLVDVRRTAARHDMTATVVSAFGTSLEATANVHLAATVPNASLGAELCTGLLAEDPVDPVLPEAPVVEVPDRPGIGVTVPDRFFETA